MKKIIVALLVLSITTISYGAITTTEGEQRIGRAIKQIYSNVNNTRNQVGTIYAKAKLYATEHPTQFDSNDKTKLKGLQEEIKNVNSAIADLKTYIETNFAGLND